jgi:YfiH family protein
MPAPFEQSRNLGAVSRLRHGFFGRAGGTSSGDFASLNVSESVGDDPETVARNRADAAAALGASVDDLAIVRQTHSSIVHLLTEPPAGGDGPDGDAMVTNRRGLVLGILTADCAPVLLADPAAGVIGAFHAGWKGAVDGIARETVRAMRELGAEPNRIVAAIGPTISQANYEVGPEFAGKVLARHRAAAEFFATPAGGREHFDLPGFVADQLHAAGIGLVEDLDRCTYAAPQIYFSHRYATHKGTGTGRQIALIGLA